MFCLSRNVVAEVLLKTFQRKRKRKQKKRKKTMNKKGQLPFNNIIPVLQVSTHCGCPLLNLQLRERCYVGCRGRQAPIPIKLHAAQLYNS
jgi:hypothetical protein